MLHVPDISAGVLVFAGLGLRVHAVGDAVGNGGRVPVTVCGAGGRGPAPGVRVIVHGQGSADPPP